MRMNLEGSYNPIDFEDNIYKKWLKNNCFKATTSEKKDPFTVIMPPPNITGQLHLGHALNCSIQDSIVRYKRMQGFSTLWVPGTDHASIATELKIVEKLREEGIAKEDLGREEFLKRAWKWKDEYGSNIVNQQHKLGISCDWSRSVFTMDERSSRAVVKTFIDYYKKGLIYRSGRIINWCPSCATALSDAEVEYRENNSFLWHIKYKFENEDGYIEIATTRPETLLGDVAIAVNPKDKKYKDCIGKTVQVPLINRPIPIIADKYVEMDFGSGAVKITPHHDPNDFEIAKRHDLESICIMNDDGTLNGNAFKYKGMTIKQAREELVSDLEKEGLLIKVEPYNNNIGECYRCKTVVEPLVKEQWFVNMKPLAGPALNAVRSKKVQFLPDKYKNTYNSWMKNVKDWCISRQLWWGHRIPAYYCSDCSHIMVQATIPFKCSACGSCSIRQDEDILDTWFSSALWPFSTLGWPSNTKDLKYFFPTDLLVTGYDIIFFWVARMVFSSIENLAKEPFSKVLIHGLVRDKDGKKMSKSAGNGIDPIEVIEKFGADSLRFSLMFNLAAGSDMRFYEEKVQTAATFMNKLWNVSKFVGMNCSNLRLRELGTFRLNLSDKWILSKLTQLINEVTVNMNKYETGLALSKIYNFVWYDFCDWYIELSKVKLSSPDRDIKIKTASVLVYVLENILKLAHPFLPFITERIYESMKGEKSLLMMQEWPVNYKKYRYKKQNEQFSCIIEIIKSIRATRKELNIANKVKLKAYFVLNDGEINYIDKNRDFIESLTNLESIEIIQNKQAVIKKSSVSVVSIGEIIIPVGNLIDVDGEIKKLKDKLAIVENEIKRSQGMLANKGFVSKAPKALIEKEEEKLNKYEIQQKMLRREIDEFTSKYK